MLLWTSDPFTAQMPPGQPLSGQEGEVLTRLSHDWLCGWSKRANLSVPQLLSCQ